MRFPLLLSLSLPSSISPSPPLLLARRHPGNRFSGSNGTSSQSGITIVNFMAGCSLAGFLFPFTDQSATRLECILIHPFFSYCRNPPSPPPLPPRPSLSLFFERDSSFRFRIHRPSKRRASGAIEWKKLYPRKSPSFYRILRNASLFPIVSLLFFQTAQLFAIIHRVSKLCTVKSTSVTRYFKRCFTTMIKENSLILGLLDDENSKKRLNFQLCSRLFNFNFFGEKKIFYCKFWGIIVKRKNSNFRI